MAYDIAGVLGGQRLIPVVTQIDTSAVDELSRIFMLAGLRVVEVTLRSPGALDALAALSKHEGLTVGAGTVTNRDQVDAVVAAGAEFIVSPGISASLVSHCAELECPVLPGAVTATEVMAAMDLGLRYLKFFPAESSGGTAAVAALRGPFPSMTFVPTGGISPTTLADYLAQPNVLAVGATWMVASDLVAARRWDDIEGLCVSAARAAGGDAAH